eukprot:739937-Alexandrium_andersonii.AAC.1
MSASLVGSEMCIRDRPRRLPLPAVPCRCRRKATAAPAGRARPESQGRPVSYTHLTLPTICSV